MRIISGKYKSRRIQAPKNLPVRPTTDLSKESLFNILNNSFEFETVKILDLFSGTGNISFEFASRGCKDITAVDNHFDCIKFIRKINEELDLNMLVLKNDVYRFLEKNKTSYDIIFADPPYDFEQTAFEKIIKSIFENKLLNKEGMLIIEHSKHTKLDHLTYFSLQKNYGGSVFSFFEVNKQNLNKK